MRKLLYSETVTTGLAIFSMLFGAGNLIFPLKVGLLGGDKNLCAISGFLLTGVLLPLIGLVSIILYDGDYESFFYRLGKIPGNAIIFICMLTIGPLYAMPRIVTLSHIMVGPFIGNIHLAIFSAIFLLLTFLGSYKESKIIDILGNIVSPLLLISLGIIIVKGLFFTAGQITPTDTSCFNLFWASVKEGFNTLDVLGTIFFASIVLTILKKNLENEEGVLTQKSIHKLAFMGLKAGALGVALLAGVYAFMSYLSVYHGYGLEELNHGELFSTISHRILGANGAIVIAVAVLMACYSTIVALAAVVSEYLQNKIFRNKLSYISCLIITLLTTGLMSNVGLTKLIGYAMPYIQIFYPVIIVLTFLNIAYRLFGFKPVRAPVLITLMGSIIVYYVGG